MKPYISCLAFSFALTSLSQGAITWRSAQNISGDSDISVNGNFDRAYTFGRTASATVNGVVFAGSNSPESIDGTTYSITGAHRLTVPGSGQPGSTSISFGASTDTPAPGAGTTYGDLSTDYRGLIAHAIRGAGGTTGAPSGTANTPNDLFYNSYTFTLLNLTPGATYEIQVWFNESGSAVTRRSAIGDLDGTMNVDGEWSGGTRVAYNYDDEVGGVGQYVIGEFTADESGEESFTFNAYASPVANFAGLNAYQLRIIPEPSHALLGAAGLFGLAFRRRRSL